MSWQATEWVLTLDGVSPVDRAVLHVYAYRADGSSHEAFPSLTALQRGSGASRSTVCDAKHRLEARGLLIRTGRTENRRPVYRLPVGVREPDQSESRTSTGAELSIVREPDPHIRDRGSKKDQGGQEAESTATGPLRRTIDKIVDRMSDVAEQRSKGRKLTVRPDLIQNAVLDYTERGFPLPQLELAALDCASWLAGRGSRRSDASATLRTWLRREFKELPQDQRDRDQDSLLTEMEELERG